MGFNGGIGKGGTGKRGFERIILRKKFKVLTKMMKRAICDSAAKKLFFSYKIHFKYKL
jgi:hypothetical protein